MVCMDMARMDMLHMDTAHMDTAHMDTVRYTEEAVGGSSGQESSSSCPSEAG
jgi:hypothetical protein